MQFTVVANPRSSHQITHQQVLEQGLRRFGIDVINGNARGCHTHYVACWGWRNGKELRDRGHDVLVMERGYLGDRFSWTSLAWNGLNGKGDFGTQPDDNSARFNTHFTMTPWRETPGEYVLVMGQVPGDASLQGKNLMPWYESVAFLAASAYGLPVHFRRHPKAAQRGITQKPRHTIPSTGTLDEALAKAHVVITYNSNSGVDAVLAGVPTITMDYGSMAWDMSGHQVGDYLKPDRTEWAAKLAWKQWSIDEIRTGVALEALLRGKNLVPKGKIYA